MLGRLLVEAAGKRGNVAAGKQRAVLACLALRANHTVSLDELADTVWDSEPPPAATATLRNYVRRLRRGLGPAAAARLGTEPAGYRLWLDPGELDLTCFEELVERGGSAAAAGDWSVAAQLFGQAVALWRDEPLVDVDCEALHREHAERLNQLKLQAIEWQVEAGLQLGRYDRLVPTLSELARHHPLRERFHAQLMLALAHSGRRAEALLAYWDARRVLVDELGIEPGPELRQVYEWILTGRDPVPSPTGIDMDVGMGTSTRTSQHASTAHIASRPPRH